MMLRSLARVAPLAVRSTGRSYSVASRAFFQSTEPTTMFQSQLFSPLHAQMFSTDAENKAEEPINDDAAQAETGDEQAAEAQSEETPAEEKEPTPEEIIEDLKAQLKEKHDHMMMAYANEENALRIAKIDIAKARDYAVQSFAKSLLDVADNLHRAREAVPAEAVEEEGNEMLKQLLEGVELTEAGLHKVFKQNGIVEFGEVGDTFDANVHEAMFMYKDPTATPGTLGQVMQTGYMLKDRCIRPAKAGIVQADE